MKKSILLTLALGAAVVFAACDTNKTKKEAAEEAAQVEASAAEEMSELRSEVSNVAEWVGTYEATLPQADGAGFVSTLTLNADNTFVFTQVANGGEGATETQEGTYVKEEGNDVIALTSSTNIVTKFKYEGSSVLMLNADGNEPENADQYRLLKKVN